MKKLLVFISMMMLFAGSVSGQTEATQDSITVDAATLADMIIDEAKLYLGRPYKWGATGPDSFDCSGFTQYVYSRLGIKIPRMSKTHASEGPEVEGGFHNLQKGDILIFGSRSNVKRPGHVGIFIELDSTMNNFSFIHASSKGVKISQYKENYYKQRFLKAVRYIPDFVPHAPEIDESQLQSWDNLVMTPDTLKLKESERRVVLFENGTWVMVDDDGNISNPTEDDIVIIYGNGTWRHMPVSEQKIPVNKVEINAAPPAATTRQASKKYHTVKSGDTLGHIAEKYDTNVDSICRMNGITSTTTLKIGLKLRVK